MNKNPVPRSCEICLSTNQVHTIGKGKDGQRYIRLCRGCRVDDLMLEAAFAPKPPEERKESA